MDDKIEEFFSLFGKDKKALIYMVIAYIIVVIVIITIIWWPKEKGYLEYEQIDIEQRQTQLAQSYVNTIANMFKNKQIDNIKSLISPEYVEFVGKSEDAIVNELQAAGFLEQNIEIKGVQVYTDGDTYVYSTTVYSGNNSRPINIIETYPYKYKIVFDNFYSYDNTTKTITNKDIKFTIKSIYRNLKYVEFEMSIENLNDTNARFDFNTTSAIQVVLEDGTKYSVANLASSEAYTDIEPNMTVNKSFIFEIPAQMQESIEYIVFNGVSLNFSTMNIQVSI